jgi:hypothetical protein
MTPRWLFIGVLSVAVAITGCGERPTQAASEEPAVVEEVDGSELSRITLSSDAARRLGITTVLVGTHGASLAVPYSAVLYDSEGHTWAYTSAEENVFQRHELIVERVEDGVAILRDGPAAGTAVVTTGAAELYGTETGVGGGGH